jgi:hypothetical protein
MNLKNTPGEPIVMRHKGAKFYCVACHKTYQKCKCEVYVSADTLRGAKSIVPRRGKGHLVKVQ